MEVPIRGKGGGGVVVEMEVIWTGELEAWSKNSGLMDQFAAVVSGNAAGERHWVLRGNERNEIREKEGMGILSGVLVEFEWMSGFQGRAAGRVAPPLAFPTAVMPSLTPLSSWGTRETGGRGSHASACRWHTGICVFFSLGHTVQ